MKNKKIRFDGWLVDLDSGDLARNGHRSRLQEQPLQVLRELVSAAGGVVTREQLIALLWPKGVVDFDTGLNTAIRKLRSALGDTADTPRYIETLPRRGYRFIAPLEVDENVSPSSGPQALPIVADASLPKMTGAAAPANAVDSGSQDGPRHPPSQVDATRRSGWLVAAIALMLLGSAAFFVARRSSDLQRNPFAHARFSPLSDMTGKAQAAAISRDGKFAAFVSDHDGQNDVWITEIGSGRYRNLTEGKALELINPAIRTLAFHRMPPWCWYGSAGPAGGHRATSILMPYPPRAEDCRSICRTPPRRSGRMMAGGFCFTPARPAIPCSSRIRCKHRRGESTRRKHRPIAIFQLGRPMILIFIWPAACHSRAGRSGACEPTARMRSASRRTKRW